VLTKASTKALAKQESSTIGKGDGYDYYASEIHAHPFFLHLLYPHAQTVSLSEETMVVTFAASRYLWSQLRVIVMPGAFRISDKSNVVFLHLACSQVKSVDLRNIDYLSQMRREKFTTVKHTLLSIYR